MFSGQYISNQFSVTGSNYSTTINGHKYTIALYGEIFNLNEIKIKLKIKGDTNTNLNETLLVAYFSLGTSFLQLLRGNFALAIWDENNKSILLARDHLGVMPLFYKKEAHSLVFSPNLKYVANKVSTNIVTVTGLREIFGIGPARTPGTTAFKDIYEILPGHCALLQNNELTHQCYWHLTAAPHTDDLETTTHNIHNMVTSSILAQTDEQTCALLSGGLDSSIIAAVASPYMRKWHGRPLPTFSYDFAGNSSHFVPSSFQPEQDTPFAALAAKELGTSHSFLEIGTEEVVLSLYDAVDAKCLPAMGDIDAGLFSFFIKLRGDGCSRFLTGETADEIFGGYPWFNHKELQEGLLFPWSRDNYARSFFLDKEIQKKLNIDKYSQKQYVSTIKNTPLLGNEDDDQKRLRQVHYATLQWFMPTLIERAQRMANYLDLTPRMPFANVDLMQYAYNIPWEMKIQDNNVKHPLREAFKHMLPEPIVQRKKNPPPKIYNPAYTANIKHLVNDVVLNKNSPLYPLLDANAVRNITEKNPEPPWFGQLMKNPQQLAYLVQVNYWLKKYNVSLAL